MNINPNAKQVLFYGDSLVYGKKPSFPERHVSDVRFTGIIQKQLGSEYNIIEEGLRARNLFDENSFFPERNGLEQFGPILGSHIPLHLVVFMLGTNNCNRDLEKPKDEYILALNSYREKIKVWCTQMGVEIPKLLIVAPPYIQNSGLEQDKNMQAIFGPDAEDRSKKLELLLEGYCQENGIEFFKSSVACVSSNNEGIHLDVENNERLGKALTEKIKNLL